MKLVQADAFTDAVFSGNPAAVLVLEEWLPDDLMQRIAMENNLSETAFCRAEGEGWALRWFTPEIEVDFCGHATLATAHVLATEHGVTGTMRFETRAGELRVTPEETAYRMEFPIRPPEPTGNVPDAVTAMLPAGTPVLKQGENLFALMSDEQSVRIFSPDFAALKATGIKGLCITGPGDECDFVSRYFAPAGGIDEDPVTGSNHSVLVPYWAERLGKRQMQARQVSARGGALGCELTESNVILRGQAVTYLRGEIVLP